MPKETCPDCGFRNLPGADACEECGQSLSALSKPRPSSEVERRVMRDRIKDLVPREPIVVAPDTPVREVLNRLVDRAIGCVVVVQEHEVVGIFSERDVLLRISTKAAEVADRPVSEFMTSNVETLELTDKIAFALHRMDLGGYRHLPILENGRIMGVISVRDILSHITGALQADPS